MKQKLGNLYVRAVHSTNADLIILLRLFTRGGKQEAEGRLLEATEDTDDMEIVVDFIGSLSSSKQAQIHHVTPL